MYSVNPIIFGSRKAQSLRTLKGAATLKIQCDTAFTEHLQKTQVEKSEIRDYYSVSVISTGP